MKHVFTVIIGSFFSILLFLYIYLGGYKEVVIDRSPQVKKNLVYKDHTGPYHEIVPVIEAVEKWAKENNIDCPLTFGEYLDDPKVVEHERLRSHGGCVVGTIPTELPEELSSKTIAGDNFIRAQFSGSPSIGPLKVYPKVLDYLENKKLKISGPVLEVYDIQKEGMVTTYLFPVDFK